jgi:GrpB-like predicted nucleotidyltransferase (UPF0157 family)
VTSESYLQQVVIGGPTRLDGPVILEEYSPQWPVRYAAERQRISSALPAAIAVEHIGSTSVPGLAAKPIIDILLVVSDSSDEPSYLPALESAGYRLHIREPDWHQHRLLTDTDPDVSVHVYSAGSTEVQRNLMFRDRLRHVPAERELYEATKRELAARIWEYRQHYADAKSEVVEAIIARAADAEADAAGVSRKR